MFDLKKISCYDTFPYELQHDRRNHRRHSQTPEEFLETKKGDCEDFAAFATEILKRNGKNAFILNVYGDRYAHTVAVFEENGTYQVIDDSRVVHYNTAHLEELLFKLYPFWKTGAIVIPSTHSKSGQIVRQLIRS